jgi:hypothetical protein
LPESAEVFENTRVLEVDVEDGNGVVRCAGAVVRGTAGCGGGERVFRAVGIVVEAGVSTGVDREFDAGFERRRAGGNGGCHVVGRVVAAVVRGDVAVDQRPADFDVGVRARLALERWQGRGEI